MSLSGHSLPVRSAPISHHVGNGLKAGVVGKGRNGKTVTISRASSIEHMCRSAERSVMALPPEVTSQIVMVTVSV